MPLHPQTCAERAPEAISRPRSWGWGGAAQGLHTQPWLEQAGSSQKALQRVPPPQQRPAPSSSQLISDSHTDAGMSSQLAPVPLQGNEITPAVLHAAQR